MKVLVTGGAGYIGSHVVRQLGEAGHDIVVYDNLSTGYPWAVTYGRLVVGDLGHMERFEQLFRAEQFEAVLHFAAHIVVPESVSNPGKYYRNNTRNTLNLLTLVEKYQVPYLVFSSTAAVYGMPDNPQIDEVAPTAPINPYGWSKLMSEQMIRDLSAATDLKHVILRYFNVSGADPQGRIGQATPEATHLIKVACECAQGVRPGMKIFGTDYDTPDGTCIRDYIHVEDLARAHVMALDYLVRENSSDLFNCGYGRGFSVREVIEAVKRISGKDFPVEETDRRPGDPAALVAGNARIQEVLGWAPQYADLNTIVKTALDWEGIWQQRKAAVAFPR